MNNGFIYLLMLLSLNAFAQEETTDTGRIKAPRIANITTTNNRSTQGYLYNLDSNAVYLTRPGFSLASKTNAEPSELLRLSATDITKITLKRKKPILRGALIGLCVGAATGAIIGFASGDDPVQPYTNEPFANLFIGIGNAFAMTAEEKAVGGALLGGTTGALAGVILGALLKKTFVIAGDKGVYNAQQAQLKRYALTKF